MLEAETTAAATPGPAEPSPATPEPAPAPTKAHDLNSLLSEFDAATAKSEQPFAAPLAKPERTAQPQEKDASTADTLSALLHDAGAAYLKDSVTQPPEVGAELLNALKPLAHAV